MSWLVTRWLLEVQPHRNFDLVLHVTSLMLVNAGRALDADYHALLARSPAAARVFLAVTELGGCSVLGDFYEAFGTAMFTADNDAVVHAPRRQPEAWALAVRRALDIALVETGLPPALAHAADTERYDAALAANTEQAARRVGAAVGAPVLHVDDAGIFGPVITSVPRGADALAMFDAVRHLVNQPGFNELQREITGRLIFT